MRMRHLLEAATPLAAAAPRAAGAQTDHLEMAAAGAWSYTGPTGPGFWATSLGHRECAGARQSPVNLPSVALSAPLRLRVQYPAGNDARLVNTGHTVDLYLRNRATLEVADSVFDFREVHIHVPAEHTVQGQRHAGEIHAVHQQGAGNRAVLTTFIAEGAHNNAWNSFINRLPGNRDDESPYQGTDLTAMLALNGLAAEQIYSYAGSLTTPLCTPNVRFLIRQRPIVLSRQQIEALAAAFARNARPVSPVTTAITLHRGTP